MSAASRTENLNLAVIETLLRDVQKNFAELRQYLVEQPDPFSEPVLQNMLEGYALVDDLVAKGIDLFKLRNLNQILEINNTVLCGSDAARRREFACHIAKTEERFFGNQEGSARDLLEWYERHRSESPWKRAAGVYVRVLSRPQLFLEGNHRSGSLLASYLLMREGLPPFVLTRKNAEAYFNPSSVISNTHKHGVRALFKLPKIKKKYAAFLEQQSADLPAGLFGKNATIGASVGTPESGSRAAETGTA